MARFDAGGKREAPRDRRGLRGDADEGAAHAAVADQFAEDEARGVAGDGEADALRAGDDRGVDADDLAARRDQRAAGIAGIERGVGLDDVLDHAAGDASGSERPSAEIDAGGHRPLEAERIADGDDKLAAAEVAWSRPAWRPAGRARRWRG